MTSTPQSFSSITHGSLDPLAMLACVAEDSSSQPDSTKKKSGSSRNDNRLKAAVTNGSTLEASKTIHTSLASTANNNSVSQPHPFSDTNSSQVETAAVSSFGDDSATTDTTSGGHSNIDMEQAEYETANRKRQRSPRRRESRQASFRTRLNPSQGNEMLRRDMAPLEEPTRRHALVQRLAKNDIMASQPIFHRPGDDNNNSIHQRPRQRLGFPLMGGSAGFANGPLAVSRRNCTQPTMPDSSLTTATTNIGPITFQKDSFTSKRLWDQAPAAPLDESGIMDDDSDLDPSMLNVDPYILHL
jgi:hypothetical protein